MALRVFLYGLLIASLLSSCASAYAATPVPDGYQRAVQRLPARHWLLVRSAAVDRSSSGQARRSDLSIHLAAGASDGQLWHEVGHIVAYSYPDIEAGWQRAFWPGGKSRGILPSRYAATSPAEDFAETYREMIEQGCVEDQDRARFMRTHIFEAGDLPICLP